MITVNKGFDSRVDIVSSSPPHKTPVADLVDSQRGQKPACRRRRGSPWPPPSPGSSTDLNPWASPTRRARQQVVSVREVAAVPRDTMRTSRQRAGDDA